jgi:cyclic pyranopterin monophosphate synthase
MSRLTHLDEKGAARMVDVGAKEITRREATAKGRVLMKAETLMMIEGGAAKKGDVLSAARIAGMSLSRSAIRS